MPEKHVGHVGEGGAAREGSASAAPRRAISRRSLLLGTGGIAVLLGLGCVKFVSREAVVRPPGGQDEARLIASCVRCEKCVEICPRDAIRLSHIEKGVVSMRTPEMDFYLNYCDFCAEENGGEPLCVATCPTKALKLPDGMPADQVILGKARLNRDWCLAFHDTGCRACYDACPYDAIELDEHRRPSVVESRCNGCGACEAACVSLTNGSLSIAEKATSRAIVVSPV